MRARNSIPIGCLISCVALSAFAQTKIDRSFTTTSQDCSAVQWSEALLEQYPDIGAACQSVEMRDGKSYVKFQGTVMRDVRPGRGLEIDFKDGSQVKLASSADLHVYIDGRRTPVTQLEAGDKLTFYVPEDRVAAQFYADTQTPATTTQYEEAPLASRAAAAPEMEDERMAATLPSTASDLPLIALAGLLMLGFGAGMTIFRFRRR